MAGYRGHPRAANNGSLCRVTTERATHRHSLFTNQTNYILLKKVTAKFGLVTWVGSGNLYTAGVIQCQFYTKLSITLFISENENLKARASCLQKHKFLNRIFIARRCRCISVIFFLSMHYVGVYFPVRSLFIAQ